jgi:hypothetical protein
MTKVSVVLPLLLPDQFTIALTDFCIKAMRLTKDQPFELVVVETGTRHFDPDLVLDPIVRPDKYIHFPKKSSYVKDFNAGCDIATGEYLVHMGNDVIVNDGWIGALLEPFDRYNDCGISACAATEAGAVIGPRQPIPGLIVEGMFAPMMMFTKQWRLDDAFEGGYSDSDLIMRVYAAGLRAYRNCRVVVHHMDRVTWTRATNDRGAEQMQAGETLFYQRWNGSPLMMFQVIKAGAAVYGREHEAILMQIPSRAQRRAF